MRQAGFEPARGVPGLEGLPLGPKPSAYAYSATAAQRSQFSLSSEIH